MSWLTMNFGTVMVSLLLTGVVTSIILWLRKKKKQGKSSCGCNCSHCSMCGECHPK